MTTRTLYEYSTPDMTIIPHPCNTGALRPLFKGGLRAMGNLCYGFSVLQLIKIRERHHVEGTET
jgi:hypothetical protein